jgi:ATP synthase protein I
VTTENGFVKTVSAKVARKLEAQRSVNPPVWFGLGMLGTIGWSVAVPTLAGALAGTWWDRHHPGRHSATLALLILGLMLGCATAWHWVATEDKSIHDRGDPP